MPHNTHKSLREGVVARVVRKAKLGPSFFSLPDEQKEFLGHRVDEMIETSNVSARDISHLAKEARAKFGLPPPTPSTGRRSDVASRDESSRPQPKQQQQQPQPQPQRSSVVSSKQVGNGVATTKATPTTASVSPPPAQGPGQPNKNFRDQRLSVQRRFDRMHREAKWVKIQNDELAKLEEEKKQKVINKYKRQEEEQHVLNRQMAEREAALQKQREADQRLTDTVVAQQREYLQSVKDKELTQKTRIRTQRQSEEEEMRKRLAERRQQELTQRAEEAAYLDEIIQEERLRQREDRERKLAAKKDLKLFLETNVDELRHRRQREDAQRERERLQNIEFMRVQEEKEEAARAEMNRQNAKGVAHRKRQDVIMGQYLQHKQKVEQAERQHQEKIDVELRQRDEEAAKRETELKSKRKEIRKDLVHSLEEQIECKKALTTNNPTENAEYRHAVQESLAFGQKSMDDFKRREQAKKREMLKVLQAQQEEKRLRERLDLKVKI